MMLKKLTLYAVVFSSFYLNTAYALDAQTTQQYCESVNNSAKRAMDGYINDRTPKRPPNDMFSDSIKSCADGILGMGIGLTIPGLGDIAGALKGLAQKALDAACQAATDQFNNAVNDALGSVNSKFDDFNNKTGTSVGVGKNDGGFGVGTGGNSGADLIDQAGSKKINNTINLN